MSTSPKPHHPNCDIDPVTKTWKRAIHKGEHAFICPDCIGEIPPLNPVDVPEHLMSSFFSLQSCSEETLRRLARGVARELERRGVL